MKRYELRKEQWERVEKLLPAERTGKRGRPRKDDRSMLNGMLWIVRSGAQWRELPEAYGPWQSVVECFFQKLKWFRRIATRYDKLDVSFLAFVYIAAIAILLI